MFHARAAPSDTLFAGTGLAYSAFTALKISYSVPPSFFTYSTLGVLIIAQVRVPRFELTLGALPGTPWIERGKAASVNSGEELFESACSGC